MFTEIIDRNDGFHHISKPSSTLNQFLCQMFGASYEIYDPYSKLSGLLYYVFLSIIIVICEVLLLTLLGFLLYVIFFILVLLLKKITFLKNMHGIVRFLFNKEHAKSLTFPTL